MFFVLMHQVSQMFRHSQPFTEMNFYFKISAFHIIIRTFSWRFFNVCHTLKHKSVIFFLSSTLWPAKFPIFKRALWAFKLLKKIRKRDMKNFSSIWLICKSTIPFTETRLDMQGCVSLIDRNDKFDRLIHCSLIEINQFDLDISYNCHQK